MQLKNLYFLILFFSLSLSTATAQTIFLENTNELIIGPENVNWLLEDQVGYYVEQYELYHDTLDLFIKEYQVEISQIETKRKIRKKDHRRVAEINEYIKELEEEKIVLKQYISLWKDLEFKTDYSKLNELASSSKCYVLLCGEEKYGESEYEIVTVEKGDKVYWEEITPRNKLEFYVEKVIIREAEEKWMKKKIRGCESSDPDDCLVWCLIEVPEQFRNVTRQIGSLCEIEGFENDPSQSRCFRAKEIISKMPIESKIRAIDSKTKKELIITDYIEVECEE